jgi:RNA polymerase sigma-70 factor (ECF subfamily)
MISFREQILREWHNAFGIAYAILRNRDSAHDAAQEATLRALRYENAFDASRPVRPWFLKIARNVALSETRKRNQFCELPEIADRESALDRLMTREVCAAAVREAANLPSAYRSALQLKWRGYQYREIAAALGIPVGTAQTRVHRAQVRLRSKCLGCE